MKDLIPLLASGTGVRDTVLLEQDVRLHLLLADIARNESLASDLVFRGGTCLIKCHFGYWRFSTDLDFTARTGAAMNGLSANEVRRRVRPAQRELALALGDHARREGLRFDPSTDVRFGRSNQLMTAFLRYTSSSRTEEVIKVDVNFVEPMSFDPLRLEAKSLLAAPLLGADAILGTDLSSRYAARVPIASYDAREILAEKGRALLTRQAAKSRDVVDLFLLEAELGLHLGDFLDHVAAKTRFALRQARRYREQLELADRRFEFLRDDDAGALLLKPLDEERFERFRGAALDALGDLAKDLRSEAVSASTRQ